MAFPIPEYGKKRVYGKFPNSERIRTAEFLCNIYSVFLLYLQILVNSTDQFVEYTEKSVDITKTIC